MRTKAIDQFCAWLEQTPMSQTIQSVAWIVPAVQTVHILAIAAVMASVLMINLRVMGIVGARQPLQSYSARFLPVIWWTLPILLATGMIMAIGEPVRSQRARMYDIVEGVCMEGYFRPATAKWGNAIFVPIPHDVGGNRVPPK